MTELIGLLVLLALAGLCIPLLAGAITGLAWLCGFGRKK